MPIYTLPRTFTSSRDCASVPTHSHSLRNANTDVTNRMATLSVGGDVAARHPTGNSENECVTGFNVSAPVPVQILPVDTVSEQVVQMELSNIDKESSRFYIIDFGAIREQYLQWTRELPRVTPFYAVKCNPNPQILRLLAHLGAGFDCASLPEIEAVLALGVHPSRIIYANPCKFPLHIRKAKEYGIDLMTVDNVDELEKIALINPNAKIVLRIVTDDRNARCAFSSKFGAQEFSWQPLLLACKRLNLSMTGVSFHVGSGSSDISVYPSTLKAANKLFELARELGFTPNLIDLGGGFPGSNNWNPSFPELAKGIREALDEHFPSQLGMTVIAEPGRYFVERSHVLVARIIARRFNIDDCNRGNNVLYYIDEGYYQSFNCIPNDHYLPKYYFLSKDGTRDAQWLTDVEKRPQYKSTIFGPTCDSIDTLYRDLMLPLHEIGEWMVFPNMGAYTASAAAPFNGYICTDFRYVDTDAFCIPSRAPKEIDYDTKDISPSIYIEANSIKKTLTPPPTTFSSDDEALVFKQGRNLAKNTFYRPSAISNELLLPPMILGLQSDDEKANVGCDELLLSADENSDAEHLTAY